MMQMQKENKGDSKNINEINDEAMTSEIIKELISTKNSGKVTSEQVLTFGQNDRNSEMTNGNVAKPKR